MCIYSEATIKLILFLKKKFGGSFGYKDIELKKKYNGITKAQFLI